jgi:hypothetical protein
MEIIYKYNIITWQIPTKILSKNSNQWLSVLVNINNITPFTTKQKNNKYFLLIKFISEKEIKEPNKNNYWF